ncbi:hypothetical protein BDV59DRAFT_185940 [Aspergillus ambiguus]|uniref:uncharacterized protein n=1 Tax=Aspergillus ambiguus TaxID=176160 RepID=UPI003CCD8B94
MDHLTHILDPEGEVILVLSNPNPPFALWNEESVPNELLQDNSELSIHGESDNQEAIIPSISGSIVMSKKKKNQKQEEEGFLILYW